MVRTPDDVLGEILLRLVRSQKKMEGARNPMAWIYRVAANAIADHQRKTAIERRMLESVRAEGGRRQCACGDNRQIGIRRASPVPHAHDERPRRTLR